MVRGITLLVFCFVVRYRLRVMSVLYIYTAKPIADIYYRKRRRSKSRRIKERLRNLRQHLISSTKFVKLNTNSYIYYAPCLVSRDEIYICLYICGGETVEIRFQNASSTLRLTYLHVCSSITRVHVSHLT